MRPPLSKIAPAALCAALLPACVAYVRPVGAWSEPVDLRLDQSSLAGTRIKVDCALEDEDGAKTPQEDDDCMKLRAVIGQTGARILLDEVPPEAQAAQALPAATADMPPAAKAKLAKDTADRAQKRGKLPLVIGDAKTERPDIRVSYTSSPTTSDHCGKSLVLFLFTFGLGPCIEDIDSSAELTLTDTARGVQIKRPLATRVRRYLGFPALILLLGDKFRPVSRTDYRRAAGEHLLAYLQNVVYSFAVAPKLEAEPPPPGLAQAGAAP